jgi:DnaK suppressor protein
MSNRNAEERIEQALSALERRLRQELGERLGDVATTSSDRPTELMDRAAEGERDYMSALSAQAGSATLEEVEMALHKLHEGTYGVCDHCGENISKRRLKARPFAVLCLDCKEIQERGGYIETTPRSRGKVDVDLADDDRHTRNERSLDDVFRSGDLDEMELSELF